MELIPRDAGFLPNQEDKHNSHQDDISCCSSQQRVPIQPLQNCINLLYVLNNPRVHIQGPYNLCKNKLTKLYELDEQERPERLKLMLYTSTLSENGQHK